ncbi:MAG: cupredoxin domain-containing protein [Candidatus Peribacteraceae bacterium]
MKVRTFLLVSSLVVLAACSAQQKDDAGSENAPLSTPSPAADVGVPVASSGTVLSSTGSATADPAARIVEVTVENWKFTPNIVTAKKGEKLVIRLKGVSGIHGFSVPDLGINQRVEVGETIDVTIPADKAGTFDFRCSVPCGEGHEGMTGKIIISG